MDCRVALKGESVGVRKSKRVITETKKAREARIEKVKSQDQQGK